MKAGESDIRTCYSCAQQFEVVLEPKAARVPLDERPEDEADINYCPFCGELNEEE